jgi:glutamine cyclotransferase
MLPANIYTISKNAVLLVSICMLASCSGDNATNEQTTTTTDTAPATETAPPPAQLPCVLVNQYPHDPTAFTEGLEYVDGHLYESTGQYGSSDIRRVELKTGKVLQQQKLDNKYFGEGLTVLNGKIYQLTYKERTGIVYDQKTMKQLKTFAITTDGWGLTNDGTNLIYGDGTENLYVLDANTLQEIKRIKITDQYGPVLNVNELEYINGFIYANQWRTEFILKIDPATGKVVGQANLAMVRNQAGIPMLTQMTSEDEPEVLNGIAYDKTGNRIFVTGKNWPKLLEVKLDK